MTVYEALTIAVIVAIAAASTAAIYIGLAEMAGMRHSTRCSTCAHWTHTLTDTQPQSCPHCRHPALLHPVRTLSHHRLPRSTDALHQPAQRSRQATCVPANSAEPKARCPR
ncbi:hypothetical protein [Antrihabitans stalactiti]|uniref:hypothetical protein n=1 Tax=Antrihabitans stalactiti TaxID=2584121 RepID=UPI00197FCC44|nr:hypothetical protein [Antrihabitans stalactiti]